MESNPVKVETPVKIPTTGIFAKINLRSPVVSKPKGIRITFDTEDSIETARRCDLFGDEQAGNRHIVTEQPQPHEQFGEYSWHGTRQGSHQDQRYIVLPRYWTQEPLQAISPASQDHYGPQQRWHSKKSRQNKRKKPYRKYGKNQNNRF